MTKPPPATRHPDYRNLYRRIVRLEGQLEDTIGHFYNVINLLRERVSVLEQRSKPEDEQTNLNYRRDN
jgi:hypothetical protein